MEEVQVLHHTQQGGGDEQHAALFRHLLLVHVAHGGVQALEHVRAVGVGLLLLGDAGACAQRGEHERVSLGHHLGTVEVRGGVAERQIEGLGVHFLVDFQDGAAVVVGADGLPSQGRAAVLRQSPVGLHVAQAAHGVDGIVELAHLLHLRDVALRRGALKHCGQGFLAVRLHEHVLVALGQFDAVWHDLLL